MALIRMGAGLLLVIIASSNAGAAPNGAPEQQAPTSAQSIPHIGSAGSVPNAPASSVELTHSSYDQGPKACAVRHGGREPWRCSYGVRGHGAGGIARSGSSASPRRALGHFLPPVF